MRKTKFTEGEYYHIYNRGVDKRIIFQNRSDYERFLYLLGACNDEKPLLNSQFYYRGSASIVFLNQKNSDTRKRIVDIVAFCLMPNHYHLLLKEISMGGISKFLQKVGTGYTMYFNTKYKRSGVLFQGAFKARHIDRDEYLTHLTRYIHLNPAEMKEPYWKKKGIQNRKNTYEFVKQYPWSSLLDYCGEKRFSALLNFELLSEFYETPKEYEHFVKSWLAKDLNFISLTIEA